MKLTRKQLRKLITETFISGPKGTIGLDAPKYSYMKGIPDQKLKDLYGYGDESFMQQSVDLASDIFPDYADMQDYEDDIRGMNIKSDPSLQTSDSYAWTKKSIGDNNFDIFDWELRNDIYDLANEWELAKSWYHDPITRKMDIEDLVDHIAKELAQRKKKYRHTLLAPTDVDEKTELKGTYIDDIIKDELEDILGIDNTLDPMHI